MNNIPKSLRRQLAADPEYKRCALEGYHECGGRITWEHTIIFAGRQVQERWAIIPICARGHEVDKYQDAHTMDKNMNKWVALNRVDNATLKRYCKTIDYFRMRDLLNKRYGVLKSL